MTEKRFILALDSGSQSSRALIFDGQGSVLGVGRHTHAPMLYPEQGAVEQDPADIRDALFSAIRNCLADWGGDPKDIACASMTTQRSTLLPCDENGTPLSDAVSWLDRRTCTIDSEPTAWIRRTLKVMGENGLLPRLLAKSQPRIWRERKPELLEKMSTIAPIEAWLHHQLTGRIALAPGGIAGVWPYSAKNRKWEKAGLLYKLTGFEERWLPEIVEAGQPIGDLTDTAAQATGLPAGLTFYACGGDKQAEALGAGVRIGADGVAAVSLGTGSSISFPWAKPVASRNYMWLTMASAEEGSWHLEYLLFRGLWTVRWFTDQLAADLRDREKEEGRPAEAMLCEEAEKVPAGSDGIVTWPRWSPTLQHPSETGTCVGLREIHTRGHFFRSLLEGIAYDLKRGLGILEKATGNKVKQIRVGGGGSRSDVVVRILADVLGLPVVNPESEELAARGAAIVAAVAGGIHGSVGDAVKAMVPEAPIVQPNSENTTLYEGIFRKVYMPGLKILRKSSGALAQAVGK